MKGELLSFLWDIDMPSEVVPCLSDLTGDPDVQAVLRSDDYRRLLEWETSAAAIRSIRSTLSEDPNGFRILLIELLAGMESCRGSSWCRMDPVYLIPTMKCFSRFVGEYHVSYGSYGFDRWWWVTRQIHARLLRIGELEYEYADAQKEIRIHIPSDADISCDKVSASLLQASAFFEAAFPHTAGWPFACESWLLSPVLEELLPADSRILKFQKLFSLTGLISDSEDYLEWVYKIAGGQRSTVDPAALPEETSLQRNMKRHILLGRPVGNGVGILRRPLTL